MDKFIEPVELLKQSVLFVTALKLKALQSTALIVVVKLSLHPLLSVA